VIYRSLEPAPNGIDQVAKLAYACDTLATLGAVLLTGSRPASRRDIAMFGKKHLGLGLALSLLTLAATAEQPYVNVEQRLTTEQLHATGLDRLTSPQLQLLNQLLREETAKVVEQSVKAAKAEKPRAEDESHRTSTIGLDDKPITSRLKGSLSGWESGTEFELENGQHWKVLKGSAKLRKPLQSPGVVLVPGLAGRWFLQVDEDLPKARVYRID